MAKTSQVMEAVIATLNKAGSRGLSCEEIEDRTGLNHNSVSASCTRMTKGIGGPIRIVSTGELVSNRSGRSAKRMRLLQPGEPVPSPAPVKPRRPDQPGVTNVFHNGTDTSRAAAASIQGFAFNQEAQVLEALKRRRMTADQIAMSTGISPQSVTARIRALKMRGAITTSSERRPTRTGRSAAVLMLVGAA